MVAWSHPYSSEVTYTHYATPPFELKEPLGTYIKFGLTLEKKNNNIAKHKLWTTTNHMTNSFFFVEFMMENIRLAHVFLKIPLASYILYYILKANVYFSNKMLFMIIYPFLFN